MYFFFSYWNVERWSDTGNATDSEQVSAAAGMEIATGCNSAKYTMNKVETTLAEISDKNRGEALECLCSNFFTLSSPVWGF